MFEQAVLAAREPERTLPTMHSALLEAGSLARQHVCGSCRNGLAKAKLRARQFEAVLASGLLGTETAAKYAALGDADRGQKFGAKQLSEHGWRRVDPGDPVDA